MTKHEIIAVLKAKRETLEANGATGLYAFGSQMRGDAQVDSDLDLIVDHEPGFTLTRLAHLETILRDVSGLSVHVTTLGSVPASAFSAIDPVQIY
ncbi:MAG: nucleotidyltransferase family protein [Hyphomicrobiaceae bacterium]